MESKAFARLFAACLLGVCFVGLPSHTTTADEVEDWPENGPRREGRTLVFPTHNVRWTLPEGSPFEWMKPARDESITNGPLVLAYARIGNQQARVYLIVQPTPAPIVPHLNPPPESVKAVLAGLIDAVDEKRTAVSLQVPLGNGKAQLIQKFGKLRGLPAYASYYTHYRRGVALNFEVGVVVPEGEEDLLGPEVEKLLQTLEFTAPHWVVGPCEIPGTTGTDRFNGRGRGEVVEVEVDGFKAKKPAQMSAIRFEAKEASAFQRIAWEARSEDQLKYMYFDAHTIRTSGNSRLERMDDRGRVKWRSDYFKKEPFTDWKLVHKGKKLWFKTKFLRRRGIGYRFSGTFYGQPFVEYGFMFDYKRHQYWFRIQYGGEGAEEHFKDLLKEITKNVKLR